MLLELLLIRTSRLFVSKIYSEFKSVKPKNIINRYLQSSRFYSMKTALFLFKILFNGI